MVKSSSDIHNATVEKLLLYSSEGKWTSVCVFVWWDEYMNGDADYNSMRKSVWLWC